MKKYQDGCPHIIKGSWQGKEIDYVCGYDGYKVIAEGVFTQGSGFDPLAMRVKCKKCGMEYYLFPLIKNQVAE